MLLGIGLLAPEGWNCESVLGKARAFQQATSVENALFLGPPLHPPGHLKMFISESLLEVLFVWVCGILFFFFPVFSDVLGLGQAISGNPLQPC